MFRGDQPIISPADDALGRDSFARSLAQAILDYDSKDNLVIGLFGAWGSGKTSVINMVISYLQSLSASENRSPIVTKFNPWNFSDQNQLISEFFRHLSNVLEKPDYASKTKQAGEKLSLYSKFFSPLKFVPGLGQYTDILQGALQTAGSAATSFGEAMKKDITATRNELNAILADLPFKIVIVIDDMDRLNNAEIRQIFQLVKALADFPNTIYLLAFDKEVILRALEKVQEGSGLEYLEKVIQVPFEIPTISQSELESLLFRKLDEIIDFSEEEWDQTYWGNLYHSGIKHFFENIRDINRFINVFRFEYKTLRGKVNTIDLIALSAIQVFTPDLYYSIRDNKDLFSGIWKSSSYGGDQSAREQVGSRIDKMIESVKVLKPSVTKDFLQRLFPKLQAVYRNTHYSYESLTEWRRIGRVCSPDNFDIFFKLSIPKGEISREEIKAILSTAKDSGDFASSLLALNEEGRITRFLDRLEDYTEMQIPPENIEAIIAALMDVGDLFPEGDAGFLATSNSMRIMRIFYQLMKRVGNQEECFTIYRNAMESSTRSIHTIIDELYMLRAAHGRDGSKKDIEPEEKRMVSADQLDQLEKIAIEKLHLWAQDGSLSTHSHLPSILFSWKRLEGSSPVEEFVSGLIESDDGLVNLIAIFLKKTFSHGISDHVTKMNWRISLKEIGEFISIQETAARVRLFSANPEFGKMDEHKKLAIQVFLDTVDGKIDDRF